MANGGQIDIKVNFIGLDDLNRIMQEVGQGATQVGNQVGQVGRAFDDLIEDGVEGLEEYQEGIEGVGEGLDGLNDGLNQNRQRQRQNNQEQQKSIGIFGALSQAIGQTGSAFGTMSDKQSQALGGIISSSSTAVSSMGQVSSAATSTGASFASMIGPIGLAALGVFELVKAFRSYFDTSNKIEAKVQAFKASLSEMTSTMELLASKQVKMTKEEFRELQKLNNEGKIRIELSQELRDTEEGLVRQQAREEARLLSLTADRNKLLTDKKAPQSQYRLALIEREIGDTTSKINRLKEKRNKIDERALEIAQEGYPFRVKFEQKILEAEMRSPIIRKQQAQAEAAFILQLEQAKNKAILQSRDTRTAALEFEYQARLAQIEKMIFTEKKYYNQARQLAEDIYLQQYNALEKQEKEMARARAKIRREARRKEREARLAEEKRAHEQMMSLNAQILQNEIKLNTEGIEQEKALLSAKYAEELRLAQDNYQKQILARQNYQLAIDALDKKAEEESLMAWKRNRDEKAKLYAKEAKELIKSHNAQYESQQKVIDGAKQTAVAFGKSALASSLSAAMAGEAMDEVLKQVLTNLASQAAVESGMEGAKSLAALAGGNIPLAGAHGAAAAAFAGVATLAGVLGANIGGGQSAPSSSASPTGAPLVSTEDREPVRQDNQPIVFNISMGTVYSTEESALTALTNAITREQNRARRGAPRR